MSEIQLNPDQQARRLDPTAAALRRVLDDVVEASVAAQIQVAVATFDSPEKDQAINVSVGRDGAINLARTALAHYVVHGQIFDATPKRSDGSDAGLGEAVYAAACDTWERVRHAAGPAMIPCPDTVPRAA